jgi:hypothetical protein
VAQASNGAMNADRKQSRLFQKSAFIRVYQRQLEIFQQHRTFTRPTQQPRVIYSQGVQVLCQRRTEPAMKDHSSKDSDAGLTALDVDRYLTLRRNLNGLLVIEVKYCLKGAHP